MAAEPELNQIAREFMAANPDYASFDGLDPEDIRDSSHDEDIFPKWVRLQRLKLAEWISPDEPSEFTYPLLRARQDYHGTRATELAVSIDDMSYEPATVLRDAGIWIASKLHDRHLGRAGQATQSLSELFQAD